MVVNIVVLVLAIVLVTTSTGMILFRLNELERNRNETTTRASAFWGKVVDDLEGRQCMHLERNLNTLRAIGENVLKRLDMHRTDLTDCFAAIETLREQVADYRQSAFSEAAVLLDEIEKLGKEMDDNVGAEVRGMRSEHGIFFGEVDRNAKVRHDEHTALLAQLRRITVDNHRDLMTEVTDPTTLRFMQAIAGAFGVSVEEIAASAGPRLAPTAMESPAPAMLPESPGPGADALIRGFQERHGQPVPPARNATAPRVSKGFSEETIQAGMRDLMEGAKQAGIILDAADARRQAMHMLNDVEV